jgi:hypothetical protein
MSICTTEKPTPTSDNRCLTEAELEEVNGGLIDSGTMAAMHAAFTASGSDLFGGNGFVGDAAFRAAVDYLKGR